MLASDSRTLHEAVTTTIRRRSWATPKRTIPAARIGLGYHAAGIQALADLVGWSAAKEIFFTARRFSADEALRMGLVNAVLPAGRLEEHVRETASRIAENAPLTVRSAVEKGVYFVLIQSVGGRIPYELTATLTPVAGSTAPPRAVSATPSEPRRPDVSPRRFTKVELGTNAGAGYGIVSGFVRDASNGRGTPGAQVLIHGTADDNVHYQSFEMLVDELIKQDKLFDMFAYPMRTHSIRERQPWDRPGPSRRAYRLRHSRQGPVVGRHRRAS